MLRKKRVCHTSGQYRILCILWIWFIFYKFDHIWCILKYLKCSCALWKMRENLLWRYPTWISKQEIDSIRYASQIRRFITTIDNQPQAVTWPIFIFIKTPYDTDPRTIAGRGSFWSHGRLKIQTSWRVLCRYNRYYCFNIWWKSEIKCQIEI